MFVTSGNLNLEKKEEGGRCNEKYMYYNIPPCLTNIHINATFLISLGAIVKHIILRKCMYIRKRASNYEYIVSYHTH